MPTLRSRGGTSTPCAGAETSAPPMRISPALGCSRPATQRSVVVLPQPEGPSSATISPAATENVTSSTAAAPAAKIFIRRSTRSSEDMKNLVESRLRRSARAFIHSYQLAPHHLPLKGGGRPRSGREGVAIFIKCPSPQPSPRPSRGGRHPAVRAKRASKEGRPPQGDGER